MQRASRYLGYVDFSNQLGMSYLDYLQARQFEKSIRFEISQQTKAVIATGEQLAEANMRAADRITESLHAGFEVLSRDIRSMTDSINKRLDKLDATLEWGFSELLLSIGQMNASIRELIKVARTPAQTWALEQYEIARDEFRRGLFAEALESVTRAIDGFGNNPGFKTEFRFHVLLGVIRFGSYANCAAEIVSPEKAEVAFLTAARYAKHDDKKEAARALLAAGRAAYVDGRPKIARGHFDEALVLDDFGELQYQQAKCCAALLKGELALGHLEHAIVANRTYAIAAAGDADFRLFRKDLDALLASLRRREAAGASEMLQRMEAQLAAVGRIEVENYRATDMAEWSGATAKAAQARSAAGSNTYFGFLDAQRLALEATEESGDCMRLFRMQSRKDIDHRLFGATRAVDAAKSRGLAAPWRILVVIGLVGTFGIAFQRCSSAVDVEQVREVAADKLLDDMRARGYNPSRTTIKEAQALGFRFDDLPPKPVEAPPVVWFKYMLGGLALTLGVGFGGHILHKGSRVASAKAEVSRLGSVKKTLYEV